MFGIPDRRVEHLGLKPQAMLLTESALVVRIGQYDDTTNLTSVILSGTSNQRVDVIRSCAGPKTVRQPETAENPKT